MTHVLIIEADRLLAGNLAGALKRQGHSVVHTADAQAAIVATDAHRPDVIILELLLAGRSGVEVLYELRSYPDWQDIPVLVYSYLPQNEIPYSGRCFDELDIKKIFYKPTTRLRDIIEEVALLTQPVNP